MIDADRLVVPPDGRVRLGNGLCRGFVYLKMREDTINQWTICSEVPDYRRLIAAYACTEWLNERDRRMHELDVGRDHDGCWCWRGRYVHRVASAEWTALYEEDAKRCRQVQECEAYAETWRRWGRGDDE